ncbi:MAG TPA: hypothetical protein VM347_20115 [Nonomuraea sp.]|nr:hypothetical protein [Nonomuraea sp.]
MSLERPHDREVVDQIPDPFVRRASLFALHVRRYRPFYALALVWVIALAAVPVLRDDDKGTTRASNLAAGGEAIDTGSTEGSETQTTTGGEAAAPTGETGSGGAPTASRTTRTVSRSVSQSLQAARVTGGKTRGGIECKAGVLQMPITAYAVPCTAAFTGDNGGATDFGVTKDKVRIVLREFPSDANEQAVDAVVAAAGGASDETREEVRGVFIPFLDKMYETYGRKVEWVKHESQNGNATDEAQSKGREGACADATEIKNLKPFISIHNSSSPYSECAAEKKILTFGAAAYYPEAFYRKYHPYLWGNVMECERISYQLSEYIGKRLLNKNAKWAGDAVLQRTKRRFGTYVPDNDGYQRCTDIAEKEVATKYGGEKNPPRFNYQLDVARFPDQAAQGIVNFKAAGVTTIVTACDPISIIFLTQAAKNQNYFPEWVGIGTALQDTDNAARLYEQDEVNGHLFGMSQLGATLKIIGPKSEAGRLYKMITGKEIPPGTDGELYSTLLPVYNAIQAAGPNLTVQSVAAALPALPAQGAPEFPVGWVSYQDGPDGTKGAGDHTAVDDAREVYWVSEPGTDTVVGSKPDDPYYAGPNDGDNGTYKETYGGKRFRNGEWPAEEPPIYPPRKA